MFLTIKNFIILSILCLGLIEANNNLLRLRKVNTKNAPQSVYCYYDGRFIVSDSVLSFSQDNNAACRDSYAYSAFGKRYIVLTLSNVNIMCNGFNNIEFWDHNGKDFKYCDSNRPSTVTFYSVDSPWIGISRLGIVNFNIRVQFLDFYSPVIIPTVTSAPITNAPTGSCSVQQIKPDESLLTRIVGGTIVNPNSWPWQVGLKERYSFGKSFFCGASLINDQWLLTAAHCETAASSVVAYLGDHNIQVDNDGELQVAAEKWISHPNYQNLENDIALVKLRNKVTFTQKIQPVCVTNTQPSIGQYGFVTGWGLTDANGEGNISTFLRQVGVPVNSDNVCGFGDLPDTQICAGVKNNIESSIRDSCQGDSGGPFVMKDQNGVYQQVGVVSYGHKCLGGGVYTNVAKYKSWIEQTIAAN